MPEVFKESRVRVNTVADLPQSLTLPHLSEELPLVLIEAWRIKVVSAP